MFEHVDREKCKFKLPAKESKLEESTFDKLACTILDEDVEIV